eukprot:CAMPEP_0117047604 /NCGR_PEP_ID=MMETSP0472-20121206/32895_1 /TAXON_ID=693140 ORGANISM="Tiarina fusus, Strain LIS" /NCGR_SAMPLE_ID=MMETSP0472 /ASSEMBLY_ACC=CAM_ASM_000603 /LENGTH=278 /DNA_ID=CAMNT_0004760361 /DNA_START=153 /DNA_END=989 /DNA_ORIENTATION=-
MIDATGFDDRNNVVATSDYEAAVRAIEETFREEAERSHDLNEDPQAQELFRAVQESLLENLSRHVQPTTHDQEYHDIVDPYHIVEDDEADDEYSENEEGGEDGVASYNQEPTLEEDAGEELEEYEEADLLDQKALQDAQCLRIRVRKLSERIQQIRERTMDRAQRVPETTEEPSLCVEAESPTDLAEEFRASVQRLSELVNNPQWANLPKELQRLQDTIEVVQKEQSRPLSQTEVAIVSRTNSSEEGEDLYGGFLSQNDGDELLSAEDRLAAFFQLVQ